MTWPTARRVLALLLPALLTSVALAQEASSFLASCSKLATPEAGVPHAAEWICGVARIANELQLFRWIDSITWAVLLTFFVGRTLSISLDPNAGKKLRLFLTSAGFAFGLMLLMTPIRSGMFDVWQYSYAFSQTHGANAALVALKDIANQISAHEAATAIAGGEAVKEMVLSEEMAATLGVAGAASGAFGKGAKQALQSGANSIKNAAKGLGKVATAIPLVRIIDLVLLPVVSFYSMIIFGSALAVIVGALVLPIGGVMILVGNGAAFLSTWTKVMLGAVLTMVIFPIMWGVTTQLAVTTPLTNFLHEVTTLVDRHEETLTKIQSEGGGWLNVKGAIYSAYASTMASITLFGNVIGMLMQVVIGLITAFGLIFLLQQLIQRFIGGIAANASNFTMRSFGASHTRVSKSNDTSQRTDQSTTSGGRDERRTSTPTTAPAGAGTGPARGDGAPLPHMPATGGGR